MSLTTSLYTGLTGLTTSSQLISVAGNNIANVNTTGFKASRVGFETSISELLSSGSAPTGSLGGTNPVQVGLGSQIGSITHDFTDGSLQPTGVDSNMAIEGNGFFVLKDQDQTLYTRSGNFKLDNNSNLTDGSGGIVQGYGVDQNFNIINSGSPQDLSIPLNALTLAEPTKNVDFSGNLNSNGDVAINGSLITGNTLYADATQTTPATTSTPLTSLFDASGTQLFSSGDAVTLSGATKDSATLPDATFQVGASSTLGDFTSFLQSSLGIDPTVTGSTAGVSVQNGAIQIDGNTGEVNDLDLSGAVVTKNGDLASPLDLTFDKTQSADGESVRTTFVAYDSLGTPMTVDLSVVLESKSAQGSTWRFYAQNGDSSVPATSLGNGTLNFDTSGRFTGALDNIITVQPANSAAAPSQQITLHFDQPLGALSALTSTASQIAATNQDGSSKGTLESFSVDTDGTIIGTFSNSDTRTLGQVVLATFTNPDGLIDAGHSHLMESASSGNAALVTPTTGGAGRIVGGSLEQSNVDISQEFINLITASTGFSANSRVLTTSDQMIQQLLSNTQI